MAALLFHGETGDRRNREAELRTRLDRARERAAASGSPNRSRVRLRQCTAKPPRVGSRDGEIGRTLEMATFVLIHGSGDVGWYWHLVEAELRDRGHEVVAPDLPCEDDSAGLPEYADAVVDAIGDRKDLVVVGQSFGGFTAPLVCDRVPVDLLVLVAGMVPSPGERPDDWLANTRYEQAGREQDEGGRPPDYGDPFYHDVPPALAAEARRRGRDQSPTPGREPWPLRAWPDVPTKFLLCRGDRVFPAAFQRRVVQERLGFTPDEIDGGHCVALSRPKELADRLEAYLAGRQEPHQGGQRRLNGG